MHWAAWRPYTSWVGYHTSALTHPKALLKHTAASHFSSLGSHVFIVLIKTPFQVILLTCHREEFTFIWPLPFWSYKLSSKRYLKGTKAWGIERQLMNGHPLVSSFIHCGFRDKIGLCSGLKHKVSTSACPALRLQHIPQRQGVLIQRNSHSKKKKKVFSKALALFLGDRDYSLAKV